MLVCCFVFAQAKEMQRAEMEELRQRDANLTALQAIGPRKKPKLDSDATTTSTVCCPRVQLNIICTNTNPEFCLHPRKSAGWQRHEHYGRSAGAAAAAHQAREPEGHDIPSGAGARHVSKCNAVQSLPQVIAA